MDGPDTDPDSPMDLAEQPAASSNSFLAPSDPIETALEAQEAHKYLLAKSYFDTREYDRCTTVFLPPTIPPVPMSSLSPNPKVKQPLTPQKTKISNPPFAASKSNAPSRNFYPRLSQKALFLALYAKYMAGEKRKDEETEMVLGPADGGMTVNRELPDLARGLEGWFAERREQGLEDHGQGWLEYLYGVILLKGKNEEEAKKWLIKSVHLYPFHWGAWQELNDLLPNTEDVSVPGYRWKAVAVAKDLAVEENSRLAATEHHDLNFPLVL
jgi:anaphase-promoting complex subunit 8